jgi:hypothetical protein
MLSCTGANCHLIKICIRGTTFFTRNGRNYILKQYVMKTYVRGGYRSTMLDLALDGLSGQIHYHAVSLPGREPTVPPEDGAEKAQEPVQSGRYASAGIEPQLLIRSGHNQSLLERKEHVNMYRYAEKGGHLL